jgi:transcriptional regulator with XRE-family HTH domain
MKISPPTNQFEEYQVALSLNVKFFRSQKNLSQEKLGLVASVDRTLVSKIERRIANPSLDVLCRLATCLEVPVTALVSIEKKLL